MCLSYMIIFTLTYSQDGLTPLHLASEKGHVGVVELLIEAGADAEIENKVLFIQMAYNSYITIPNEMHSITTARDFASN